MTSLNNFICVSLDPQMEFLACIDSRRELVGEAGDQRKREAHNLLSVSDMRWWPGLCFHRALAAV
jgi:hypothetical protein